jgi:NADPH:quinone reductase-like Zn-dependent oxidoreductase
MFIATSASFKEPLRLVEVPSRPLRKGEIRVKVRSVGVNPVDWKMREGGPLGTAQRVLGPSGPLVVGVDFAGEVSELGPGVTEPAVGSRVVGGTNFSRGQRGSYADEVVVRPDQCAVLPDGVSFDDAACLPVPGVTAWRSLTELGGIGGSPGQKVLVLGASGGVGLFAIQMARSLGASAFGVCSSRNAALVEELGARAIDYTAGDPIEQARAHGPFDLVLNAIGSAVYPLAACRSVLAPRGVIVLVVVKPGDYPSVLCSSQTKTVLGTPTRDNLAPLVAALAKGELKTLVEARYPLAEAEQAHVRSRGGKVVGKLLLNP